jgi:hypothetical protein
MTREALSVADDQDRIIRRLLVQGGDERIALDAVTGRNRYGHGVLPDIRPAFGSSTGSAISASAFASLAPCAKRLLAHPSPGQAYAVEMEVVRRRLAGLCGLPDAAASDIILAASGTDLHLIAADLACGSARAPLVTVMAEAAETGRGVPDAVRFRRFAASSPFGAPGVVGERLAGAPEADLATVHLRDPDGVARSAAAVDEDFRRLCLSAVKAGARILLVLVDVSKTGLVAPSRACAAALKRQMGPALTVLVDACQFRLSPASLAAYLSDDFLVAVTGSKFIGGPAFSGAMFVPPETAAGLRRHVLLPALGDISSRHDWPASFQGRVVLPDAPNLGLLMRWLAALEELSAFQAHPAPRITQFMRAFAARVAGRLDAWGCFERVATPALDRADPSAWDAIQTIFPFIILEGPGVMSAPRVRRLHERLRGDGFAAATAGGSSRHIDLGQPVTLGMRDDQPLSALRMSLSARLVSEALDAKSGQEAVIERALDAIDVVAEAAQVA